MRRCYLQDNLRIFDNLVTGDALMCRHPEAPRLLQRGEGSRAWYFQPSVARNAARNSNVSKILPLTTLRTIDLGGRKISGPLFSRFCAKTRVFFEVFYAPEVVQVSQVQNQVS